MDFNNLGNQAVKHDNLDRATVKNRVLQYDSDFACYEVSDLEEPFSKSYERLLTHIDFKRRMAGAEKVNPFITLGTKSGREEMAVLKPYQENRDPDAPIKVRVRQLRHQLANDGIAVHNPNYEADDLMCIYQNQDLANSVLCSGDKDLWMVQGTHMDAKTGQMSTVDGYGSVGFKEVGNVKPKLMGLGTSWFWHQMIMGDTVDNIPGLDKLSKQHWDLYEPLKSGKPRPEGLMACGSAKAVAMLKGVTSDVVAAGTVFAAYYATYGKDAEERFFEQAYLLWMQRTYDPLDVLTYLKSIGLNIRPTARQLEVINNFSERVQRK